MTFSKTNAKRRLPSLPIRCGPARLGGSRRCFCPTLASGSFSGAVVHTPSPPAVGWQRANGTLHSERLRLQKELQLNRSRRHDLAATLKSTAAYWRTSDGNLKRALRARMRKSRQHEQSPVSFGKRTRVCLFGRSKPLEQLARCQRIFLECSNRVSFVQQLATAATASGQLGRPGRHLSPSP